MYKDIRIKFGLILILDVNDLDVLRAVGLSAMPPNSPILDQFNPDHLTTRSGGDGAFRDFVDFILSQQ